MPFGTRVRQKDCNMEAWQERTALLLGDESLQKLSNSRVLVAGLGGVGACAAEMLVRAGIGHLDIIDADKVSESNINRQIIALHSTIGRLKTDVLSERLKDIAPNLQISAINEFLHEDNIEVLLKPEYDFVVDAIDTLSPKTALISWCLRNNLPLVSSMGSGAKTDITSVRIADISKTNTCPLARALRGRLSRLASKMDFRRYIPRKTNRERSSGRKHPQQTQQYRHNQLCAGGFRLRLRPGAIQGIYRRNLIFVNFAGKINKGCLIIV